MKKRIKKIIKKGIKRSDRKASRQQQQNGAERTGFAQNQVMLDSFLNHDV